jgi:hypothetical protein
MPLRAGTIVSVADMPDAWWLKVADSAYLQQIAYNKADSNISTSQLNTLAPGGPEAIIRNSVWELKGANKLPTMRKINITNGAQQFYSELELQNGEWNLPLEFPFNVPKSYKVKQ